MPRNYKRKTARANWSEDLMLKALDAVKDGMPYRSASKIYMVPVMSLKRRARGTNKVALGAVKYLGGIRTVFTTEQENELVNHIKDMEKSMYGLTKSQLLSLAYQLAEKNNISHRFHGGKAGIDWLRGFRQRHPDITLRAPESTSAARARAFNKPVVDKFYSVLKDVQDAKHFPPHRIYNIDETSISTVPTKNTKVFAETGRKQVARITSAERGETTTAVISMSASGTFVPPMFIFRRVRMKMELMDGAPPGSTWACNATGWMKLEVFTKWFDHFLKHTKPSEDDPVLLILDGHLSHTKNLSVILKARENYVTIICLPPHCTHKLQPLDVSVMYPLSVYHNQSLEKWMNNNAGRPVTAIHIAKIFGEAYLKAAVPANAINGFEKTGIYPYNPDVFTEVDFIAAATTEMEWNEDENENGNENETQTDRPTTDSNTEQVPPIEPSPQPEPPINRDQISVRCPLSPRPSTSYECNRRSESPSILDDQNVNFVVSPALLQPLPRIEGRRSNVKRKRTHTSVLTSTPYKNFLEDEDKKKTDKENRKIQREQKSKKTNQNKKPKGKGKGVGKGMSNKRKKSFYVPESGSSSEDEDAACLFCTETYSKDNMGEGWIRCCVCQKWGHEACAGIDSDDPEEFTCDLCVDAPWKKRLEL